MDKQSLKGLKDATPEDRRLAEEVEQAERKAGFLRPSEKSNQAEEAENRLNQIKQKLAQ